ncbi:O-antigen polymerase [Thermoflexus sp.]|uniref:O-antigen polymerase n=1 Tax=Thermoflexus sp. TaxID=1969742 RepID=UPI0035E444A2
MMGRGFTSSFFLGTLFYLLLGILAVAAVLIVGPDSKSYLVVGIATFGLFPFVRASLRRSEDLLAPSVLLPLTYALYALGPISLLGNFSDQAQTQYLFLQFWGLLALRVGISAASKRSKVPASNIAFPPLSRRWGMLLLLTAFGMLAGASVSVLTLIASLGSLGQYLEIGYGGDFYLSLRSGFVIGIGFQWWLLGTGLLIYYGIRRSTIATAFGLVLSMLAVIVILKTGRRHEFLFPLIYSVVLINYGYKRIPSLLIATGVLLGIATMQYYALARFFLAQGFLYSLFQTWPMVVKNPYLLLPWNTNEFKMPGASLIEVLEYGGPGLLYGASYLTAVVSTIPFLGRLVSGSLFHPNNWRLETFYPEILAAGGGLGFSPVTEAFINFGYVGIFVHLFLYGYIIGAIYNRLIRRPSVSRLLLYAGSLPIFMLHGMRVESASFIYLWVRYLVPWIVFGLLNVVTESIRRRGE